MIETMLTTFDNPHDPFEDFPAWYSFDQRHGYNTLGLLARLAAVSPEISDADYDAEVDSVIESIIRENPSGMHRKVTREIPDSEE